MIRLVVAPHADDEILGCGGTIRKYAQETSVLVVSQMSVDRRNEHVLAMREVHGYPEGSLGFVDGAVGADPRLLTDVLDSVIAEERPEWLYLPYPGSHQDHVAVYEAGMRAARLSMNTRHWSPPNVLIYETPVYDLDTHDWPLRYSLFESLTHEQVDAKARAMAAYESQCPGPAHPGDPEQLVARARSLGLARGVEYAEQFAPVRMVIP